MFSALFFNLVWFDLFPFSQTHVVRFAACDLCAALSDSRLGWRPLDDLSSGSSADLSTYLFGCPYRSFLDAAAILLLLMAFLSGRSADYPCWFSQRV